MIALSNLKQLVSSIKTVSTRLGIKPGEMHVVVIMEEDRVSEVHLRGVGTEGKITVFIELD